MSKNEDGTVALYYAWRKAQELELRARLRYSLPHGSFRAVKRAKARTEKARAAWIASAP